MKRLFLLAVSTLMLTSLATEQADARRLGVRAGVVGRGPVIVGRGPIYGYRRGYRPGVGAAQVVDAWGNAQWAYVRVC